MDVSIIIVNYNTCELTLQCLKSIYDQTRNIIFEIIVVDNASSDNSCNAIKNCFPSVLLIESDENLGFGRANNLGAQYAKGKYLFLLNSDTLLLNNSIYYLFQFNEAFNKKLKIGVTGGILIDENKKETGSFGPLPSKTKTLRALLGFMPRFTKMRIKELKKFHSNGYLEVGYITGADMFINKMIFEELGGFDPSFFMYYEETDFQLRLKNNNYCNYIIDNIQIIHFEGASLKHPKKNNLKRIIITKSMFYFYRKHSNNLTFIIFKILFLIIRIFTLMSSRYSWRDKNEYLLQIIKS